MVQKFLIVLLLAILTACAETEMEAVKSEEDTVPDIITAELTVPAKVTAGEKQNFEVKVAQGAEPVTDAEEVLFEFWLEDAKGKSEKINAVSQGEGIYSVSKSFSENGTYHVQSHVTARSMHVMPKKSFSVTGEDPAASENHTSHEKTHESEAGHHVSLEAELISKDTPAVGKETYLEATIKQEGNPLTGGSIMLEIPEEAGGDPVWVNLEETHAGLYQGTTIFSKTGSFSVTIHIKKEDLHDHVEKTLEVIQ